MSSSQRRAGQLSCLSAWGPLLDVPVDRDGHLCGFLGAGALRGGLAGAAAELMALSRRRFRLEGSVRGGATPHPRSPKGAAACPPHGPGDVSRGFRWLSAQRASLRRLTAPLSQREHTPEAGGTRSV